MVTIPVSSNIWYYIDFYGCMSKGLHLFLPNLHVFSWEFTKPHQQLMYLNAGPFELQAASTPIFSKILFTLVGNVLEKPIYAVLSPL